MKQKHRFETYEPSGWRHDAMGQTERLSAFRVVQMMQQSIAKNKVGIVQARIIIIKKIPNRAG